MSSLVSLVTVDFKMPRWMPGYYQIMYYSREVRNFSANCNGKSVTFINADGNTWRVVPGKSTSFSISYDVFSARNFVASNFLDSTHGYIVPAAIFVYPSGYLDNPVRVKIIPLSGWKDITTGLDKAAGLNTYTIAFHKENVQIVDYDLFYLVFDADAASEAVKNEIGLSYANALDRIGHSTKLYVGPRPENPQMRGPQGPGMNPGGPGSPRPNGAPRG